MSIATKMAARAELQATSTDVSVWDSEVLFFDGDSFFSDLCEALATASKQIDIEVYIFENDRLGDRIVNLLENAAKRGVPVRLVVDGVGSSKFASTYGGRLEKAGVTLKIYHETPFRKFLSKRRTFPSLAITRVLGRLNQRDHRKVYIIDEKLAWVGSLNVSECHLGEFHGEFAWRDTGVKVSGKPIEFLIRAFERAFGSPSHGFIRQFNYRRKGRFFGADAPVRLNSTRKDRRSNYRDLLLRIRNSQKKIWIETAYFVPRRSLLRALRRATKNGVEVKLMVPHKSDVKFMPVIARVFYRPLLEAGIEIYEYLPSMLHAKVLQIDDWAIVGSTNLNHRSVLHDLELDIELTREHSRNELSKQFDVDLSKCKQITREDIRDFSWWERFLGNFLMIFKRLL